MANQYSGSLEHRARERFQCSAKELLERFANGGISYSEAEKCIGVSHGTIRKWARRYDLILGADKPENLIKEQQEKAALFSAAELNSYNFLSRRWG